MVLKLDSRIPMVWRDPFSLQLGVEPARLVLREMSVADERMISALVAGISRSGLGMIARSAGGHERDADRLLRAVAPLLLDDAPPAPKSAPTVAIVGSGPTVDRIAGILAESRIAVKVTRSVSDEPCDLGIAVGHYVLDPEEYGFWLRRDLPHLPVLFGDGTATVGPLVEPGVTPCLYCLEHYRRDADVIWSTLASQLWGRRSAAETPLASHEVAAMVGRLVVRRLGLGAANVAGPAAAASFRLAVETGQVTRREWMPHPACGCLEVPNAARAESDLAVG
jgi:bacteriocin biosynthesis cyclodehydratase domain-containing protein